MLACPMAELPGLVSKITFTSVDHVQHVCEQALALAGRTPKAFRADLCVAAVCCMCVGKPVVPRRPFPQEHTC